MRHVITLLVLFMLVGMPGRASAAQQQPRDTTLFNSARDSTIFYIDWSQMTPQTKATFIRAFGEIAKRNDFYKTVTIQPNDNISKLIKRYYDVVAEVNNHSHQALIGVLKDLNGLDAQNTLVAGKSFKLLRLPIKQVPGSKDTLAQFFDPYIKQSYILSTASAANSDFRMAKTDVNFREGGLSAFKLSPEDLTVVKSMLSKNLYRSLYGTGIVTLDSVHISTVRFPERKSSVRRELTHTPIVDSTVARLLNGLSKDNFGTYYVFDNFNAGSEHGEKVMDVVNARFAAYGLDTTGLRIHKIPINYFDNVEFGQELIKKYYAVDGTPSNKLPSLEIQHELNQLKGIDVSKYAYAQCQDCIPEVYLHALFGYYYRDTPDVISSSFWADMELKGILPRLYTAPVTSLVTAGLNEDGEIEHKIRDILVEKDLLVGSIQPINDYFNSYADDGALIIGNRLTKGVYSGSYGKHITTTGLGVGWAGRTIMPTDTGTSFATPDVAGKIYIAKAYWRSKKMNINAAETRMRVLLATDIDPEFIGKFESAGSLNMLKLLQPGNYVETVSGEILPLKSISLSDAGIGSSKFKRTPFGRRSVDADGEATDGVCGFACVDGRFYKFTEMMPWWQPANFKEIAVSFVTSKGPEVIQSQEAFSSKFKQLIILSNHEKNN